MSKRRGSLLQAIFFLLPPFLAPLAKAYVIAQGPLCIHPLIALSIHPITTHPIWMKFHKYFCHLLPSKTWVTVATKLKDIGNL